MKSRIDPFHLSVIAFLSACLILTFVQLVPVSFVVPLTVSLMIFLVYGHCLTSRLREIIVPAHLVFMSSLVMAACGMTHSGFGRYLSGFLYGYFKEMVTWG